MKPITTIHTANGILLASKTTENQIKIQLSKFGHFSPIPICLPIIYVLYYTGWEMAKCSVVIPSYCHQAIPMLFPIPTELQQHFPFQWHSHGTHSTNENSRYRLISSLSASLHTKTGKNYWSELDV